jgi:hypothetical protein
MSASQCQSSASNNTFLFVSSAWSTDTATSSKLLRPYSSGNPAISISLEKGMGTPVDSNHVKVYTVNGAAAGSSSAIPDWLTKKRIAKKGKRVTRELIQGSIELLQDFEFPEASNRIKTTRDGQFAIATGTYKPQMRVWDLHQLSMKFERHSDAENVDFLVRESPIFLCFLPPLSATADELKGPFKLDPI